MKDEEIVHCAEEFEKAKLPALAAMRACHTFMAGKHRLLMGATEPTKKAASEFIQRVGKLERSLAANAAKISAAKGPAKQRIEAEVRRKAAIEEAKRQEAIFKKFDSNGDGLLSMEDIIALCKVEYDFDLEAVKQQSIKTSECFRPQSGVSLARFAQLRTIIGIARNEAMAKRRREEEIERKKRADQQCRDTEASAKTLAECMTGIEAEVRKAEVKCGPLVALSGPRTPPFAVAVVETALGEVDTAVAAARDFIAAAQEQLQAMNAPGGKPLEPEAQRLASKHNQLIGLRLKGFETRLARPDSFSKTARQKVELQQRKEALLREASEMI